MRCHNILLRFDDICPTMNWEQWEKAKTLLDKTGAKALLGVIPDCKDPDLQIEKPREYFWDYIKELQKQGHIIAMHGCQHVFDSNVRGLINKAAKSEFAGHSYEIQYEKIKKGKNALLEQGIETEVFFAPAHSYDENTLKALAANGFKYMSDGYSRKPYLLKGIKCIPLGYPTFSTYVTRIVHAHEWTRADKKKGWYSFQKLLNQEHNQFVSFEEVKLWPEGSFYIQRIIERLMLVWYRHIKPVLAKVKHIVFRIVR